MNKFASVSVCLIWGTIFTSNVRPRTWIRKNMHIVQGIAVFRTVSLQILFNCRINFQTQVWKIVYFGLKRCKGFQDRAAHSHTKILWPFDVSHPRYKAIVKEPLLYSAESTQRYLAETVLYLWILPTVSISIDLMLNPSQISYNNQTFVCESSWGNKGATADTKRAIYAFALFIVPLLVIITLNYSVFKTAREKSVEPAGVASQVQLAHRAKFHQEHRAAIDVAIVVGAFLVLFLPLWVTGIARRFSKDGLDESFNIIPIDLSFSSGAWNPFIYAIRKGQFRRAMSSLLRCRGRAAGQVTPQSSAPERWAVPPGLGIKETVASNATGSSGV